MSVLGTPFLSVQKIATKVIKEQIFRRKIIISCVSLGKLEELNSGFLNIIVILQQNTFTERHESKVWTFYFPLPFSAGSSWKSTVNKIFGSGLLKLTVWAWVRKAERILCLFPMWLKQSWATLTGPRVEFFLRRSQTLLCVMSYLLAASKREEGLSSKEKHNPNQTIFQPFSEHHPQICNFWFIFLMFGHTCRILYRYHREQTQDGFYCSLANVEPQEKESQGKKVEPKQWIPWLLRGSGVPVLSYTGGEEVALPMLWLHFCGETVS